MAFSFFVSVCPSWDRYRNRDISASRTCSISGHGTGAVPVKAGRMITSRQRIVFDVFACYIRVCSIQIFLLITKLPLSSNSTENNLFRTKVICQYYTKTDKVVSNLSALPYFSVNDCYLWEHTALFQTP